VQAIDEATFPAVRLLLSSLKLPYMYACFFDDPIVHSHGKCKVAENNTTQQAIMVM
jgi:hypothetical protein